MIRFILKPQCSSRSAHLVTRLLSRSARPIMRLFLLQGGQSHETVFVPRTRRGRMAEEMDVFVVGDRGETSLMMSDVISKHVIDFKKDF